MTKDLVYEMFKENTDVVKGNPVEVSERYTSHDFREVQHDIAILQTSVEKIVSRRYPEIKKARITLEFE